MPVQEQRRSFNTAGRQGWVTVEINHDGSIGGVIRSAKRTIPGYDPLAPRLFEHTTKTSLTFSERFPRLTFACVALALLAFTVTAEIEYLVHAGFQWR